MSTAIPAGYCIDTRTGRDRPTPVDLRPAAWRATLVADQSTSAGDSVDIATPRCCTGCTAVRHVPTRATVRERAVVVRRARTADVPAIKAIVDIYAGSGRKLLAKELVTLYEDVQDFQVAELDGEVVGCGALHVLWADLGEVRTLAVASATPRQRHRRGQCSTR